MALGARVVELISDEIERIPGYLPSGFLASTRRTMLSIVHPDDLESGWNSPSWMRASTSCSPSSTGSCAPTATCGGYSIAVSWCPGPGGRLWIDGAMFDVTERRAAEEAVREREVESGRAAMSCGPRAARVVAAADEGRRRIERDLHDGAQQRLELVTLEAQAHRAHAPRDSRSGGPGRGLEQLQGGAGTSCATAPTGSTRPCSTGRGLDPALDGLVARSPVPVRSDAAAGARPPIEAAIYYTVAEALTNVAKYAQATQASVTIEVQDGTLVAEVADDGVGGASMAGGSGLRGLEDRLDAIGGTLTVHSRAGKGTTIRACAPLDPGV